MRKRISGRPFNRKLSQIHAAFDVDRILGDGVPNIPMDDIPRSKHHQNDRQQQDRAPGAGQVDDHDGPRICLPHPEFVAGYGFGFETALAIAVELRLLIGSILSDMRVKATCSASHSRRISRMRSSEIRGLEIKTSSMPWFFITTSRDPFPAKTGNPWISFPLFLGSSSMNATGA